MHTKLLTKWSVAELGSRNAFAKSLMAANMHLRYRQNAPADSKNALAMYSDRLVIRQRHIQTQGVYRHLFRCRSKGKSQLTILNSNTRQ